MKYRAKTSAANIAPGSEVEKAGVRGSERPRIRFGIKEQRAIGALFPKVRGRKHDRGRRKERIGAWSGSGIDNWKSRISIAGRTGRISAAVISVPPFRCSRAPLTRGTVRVSLLKFLRLETFAAELSPLLRPKLARDRHRYGMTVLYRSSIFRRTSTQPTILSFSSN